MREGTLARINDAVSMCMLKIGGYVGALPRAIQAIVVMALLAGVIILMRMLGMTGGIRMVPMRRVTGS
jgi:hypothetical protein